MPVVGDAARYGGVVRRPLGCIERVLAVFSPAFADSNSDSAPQSAIPSVVGEGPVSNPEIAPPSQQSAILHFIPRTHGANPRSGQIEGARPAGNSAVGKEGGTGSNSSPASKSAPGLASDIPYVQDGGKSRSLDIRLPVGAENAPVTKRFPLVVFIHGGGWSAGDKGAGPFRPLLREGFAVASINYRLSGEAIWPAQVHDCKAAIRWLRANGAQYHLDTKKIGVWGTSAGGHLVALLGTTNGVKSLEGNEGNLKESSSVQAVCDWFGPADFVRLLNKDKPPAAVVKLLGGTDPDLAKAASPMTYVNKKTPPFLIIHGDQDPLVPLAQSQSFADALKKAGVDCTLRVVDGAGHGKGFTPAESDAVVDFFKKQLL